MNHLGDGNGHLERRRQIVASILVRKPKTTQRQIMEFLAERMLNPDTGAPYSLGTINNDIQAIRQGWQECAIRDYGEWVAEELATINEVAEEAWKRSDLDLVLKCSDRRCKLLGLDKPMRLEVDWRQEAKEIGLDPSDVFEQYVAAAAAAIAGEGDAETA